VFFIEMEIPLASIASAADDRDMGLRRFPVRA
jgi:hypothetical protein